MNGTGDSGSERTEMYSMQTRTLIDALDQASRTRKKLPEEPLVISLRPMSGVGNCYDNASIESFWSRMKDELRGEMLFDDLLHARTAVYKWVHLFYNRKRMHSSLNFMSPIEFEEDNFSQL